MGSYRYYLWLGIWSTTTRDRDVSERTGDFDSITIFADGEPLELDVHGRTLKSINVSDPIYPKPASSAIDAYYEVTVDQVRRIAGASEVRLHTGSSPPDTYAPWDSQRPAFESVRAFLDYGAF